MSNPFVIGGGGLWKLEHAITNAERDSEIATGTVAALEPASAEFIEKVSGIEQRFPGT
jgi:hypothetical protein